MDFIRKGHINAPKSTPKNKINNRNKYKSFGISFNLKINPTGRRAKRNGKVMPSKRGVAHIIMTNKDKIKIKLNLMEKIIRQISRHLNVFLTSSGVHQILFSLSMKIYYSILFLSTN